VRFHKKHIKDYRWPSTAEVISNCIHEILPIERLQQGNKLIIIQQKRTNGKSRQQDHAQHTQNGFIFGEEPIASARKQKNM
jgi:hypothetical protein